MDIACSTEPAFIQPVEVPWIPAGVKVAMLRADRNDPVISGNKAFKLRYNLQTALARGHDTLLSFGGPWSNHLHALAAAGRRLNLRTIGVVRGERPVRDNACIADLERWGMTLHFVTRADYRRRHEPVFLDMLTQRFGPHHVIPEGGANLDGIRGCQEMLPAGVTGWFDHIMLACGTGTTLAGIITASPLRVTGIQALRGEGYLLRQVQQMLQADGLKAVASRWEVRDEFHCGGFGRVDAALRVSMHDFTRHTGIPLEPLYSGKLVLALQRMCENSEFTASERILLIHGGGLQGLRGMPDLATS